MSESHYDAVVGQEKPSTSHYDAEFSDPQPSPRPRQQSFGEPTQITLPGDPTVADQVVGTLRNMPAQFGKLAGGVREAVMQPGEQTRATQELPEVAEVGVDKLLGDNVSFSRKAGVAAALASTFDAEEAVQILRAANPDLGVSFDERRNVIVTNNDTGLSAVVNRPGLSTQDVASTVGTGALFTPAAGGGSAMRVGFQAAGTQAGIESGQAVAGGEFSPQEVAIAGGGGALFQGIFNRMAQAFPALRQGTQRITEEVREAFRREASRVGLDPSQVTDELIQRAATESRQSASPEAVAATALEQEFNIPFSRGQRTLEPSQVEFEDLAGTGTFGERARAPMDDLATRQRNRIREARTNVAETIGADQPRNARQTGELVSSGVRSAEDAMSQAVNEAYEAVGDAALSPRGFRELLVSTRKALIGPEFDRTLPETAKALDRIRNILRVEQGLEAAGTRMADVPITQIDGLRKRLNSAIGSAQGTDRAQIIQMKRAFDDYLDRAVIDGLFSGDDEALGQLKQARSLFAEYAKRFRENPEARASGRVSDPSGRFIERIVSSSPTGEEVVNAMFGAGNLEKGSGAALATRFRSILGEGSEEWNAVRRAAFDRLVKTGRFNGEEVISGKKTMDSIERALERNDTLMRTLFSDDEIGLMRRFAAAVQRTDPQIQKSRLQPSGNIRALRQIAGRLGGAMGDTSMLIISEGAERVSASRAARRAQDAASLPFARVRPAAPGFAGGGLGASGAVMGETQAPDPRDQVPQRQ